MGLTWRDLASSIAMLLMVVAYVLFVSGVSLGMLSSAVVATTFLWLTATIWHVLAIGSQP